MLSKNLWSSIHLTRIKKYEITTKNTYIIFEKCYSNYTSKFNGNIHWIKNDEINGKKTKKYTLDKAYIYPIINPFCIIYICNISNKITLLVNIFLRFSFSSILCDSGLSENIKIRNRLKIQTNVNILSNN